MNTEPTIFTRIIAGEIPGYIPYQDDIAAVLIALEGHILVVPKTPYPDLFTIPDTVAAHLMTIATKVAKVLPTITNCTGVNLIQSNGADAGQEVFHVHLHVLPRYTNDSVTLGWDTTTAPDEVRAATAAALAAALK